MKRSTIVSPLKILAAIMLLGAGVVAQERQDTPAKQELALEVSRGVGRPMEIPAFKGAFASAASFMRIESWKPSTKETAVKTIDFKIDREGDIVIAHVSVRLENEKEMMAGTYRLREGETIRTEDLEKFGLQPLVLKVVKAKPNFKDPLPPIPPQLENKTKAIEVVSFYQEELPSGRFQLTLRNVSSKNIMVLDLFMASADGNGGEGQRARGEKGHPVFLPGSIFVHHIGVSRGGRTTSEGFVPDIPLQRTLIIRTVVFDDGTYDGLVEPAAEIEAERRGLDIQRRRIVRLLQETKETDVRDALTTVGDLKEQAYALSKTADPSIVADLLALFPSLNEKSKGWWIEKVENGLSDGKRELLRYLNEFEDMQKQPGEHLSFAQWIKQTKANYERLITPFWCLHNEIRACMKQKDPQQLI